MWKKCEKKDPYIDSIVHQIYILLTFKVRILFLLVYIRFLTFTIYTLFFNFPSPRKLRYVGNFQSTLLLRPPVYLALKSISLRRWNWSDFWTVFLTLSLFQSQNPLYSVFSFFIYFSGVYFFESIFESTCKMYKISVPRGILSYTTSETYLQVFKKENSKIFCNKKNVNEKVKHPIFLFLFLETPASCLWFGIEKKIFVNERPNIRHYFLFSTSKFFLSESPKFYFRLNANW